MSIAGVIRTLTSLQEKGLLGRYAIMGGVATAVYMTPISTEGIDIIVEVASDSEFVSVFRNVGTVAERIVGLHHVIDGTKVQLFPSNTKPIYAEALDKAVVAQAEPGVQTRVVRREHLIVMLLESFRLKDRFRILELWSGANEKKVRDLIRKHDDTQQTLARRFASLLQSRS